MWTDCPHADPAHRMVGPQNPHRPSRSPHRVRPFGAEPPVPPVPEADEAAQARRLSSFSGGWRMRVALAATLFAAPDLLLLDEPSNHLDLEATLWLESFLKSYRATIVVISHERDLLNNVVDTILHLQGGKLTLYPGGYDAFERQRAERQAQQAACDAVRPGIPAAAVDAVARVIITEALHSGIDLSHGDGTLAQRNAHARPQTCGVKIHTGAIALGHNRQAQLSTLVSREAPFTGMLLQQQSGLTIIALRIVVPFSHPHHPVCPVFLLHQLQETGLSIAMRPIAETAGNQTKRSGLPCTQAA